jgi:haloalkane dehalogenase
MDQSKLRKGVTGMPHLLKTPDDQFVDLPGFPYAPHYVDVAGMAMHYVDEGHGDPILCLHGEPSWSYLYRKMIPVLARHNRVVAPDYIGFGRSDKLPERSDYTYAMHHDTVAAFVEALDLRHITLVCQDWGGPIGLAIAAGMPDRFARLVIMNTFVPTGEEPISEGFLKWRVASQRMKDMDAGRIVQGGTVTNLPEDVVNAYNAPFPDYAFKAGAYQFPMLVPTEPNAEAAEAMRKTRAALRKWTKPALIMFSDQDPIMSGGDKFFRELIPSARSQPEIIIHGAGHFLQEDKGEELAEHTVEFIRRS